MESRLDKKTDKSVEIGVCRGYRFKEIYLSYHRTQGEVLVIYFKFLKSKTNLESV